MNDCVRRAGLAALFDGTSLSCGRSAEAEVDVEDEELLRLVEKLNLRAGYVIVFVSVFVSDS